MKTTVSEKGQITIPKRLRDSMGIQPGSVLDFKEQRGHLIATKIAPTDPVDTVYGVVKFPRSTDELVRELRGEHDEP